MSRIIRLELSPDQADLLITALRMYAAECAIGKADPSMARYWAALELRALMLAEYVVETKEKDDDDTNSPR